MERKEVVDWVILQVALEGHEGTEAIAIKDGYVVALGTIPFVFSNFKGDEVFHGQGNTLCPINGFTIGLKQTFHAQLVDQDKAIIATWEGSKRTFFNEELLDPHWDDH